MQRLTTKKIIKVLLVFALNIAIGLGMMATAQEKSSNESKSISFTTLDDGKVKIKVVIKSGDDKKIFEKTYDSYEDMEDDPELEEYGISSSDLNFGNGKLSFGSQSGNVFIRRGSGATFFGDDDDHGSSIFFNLDSLDSRFQQHFGANGSHFRFNFDDDDFKIHGDSLSSFSFGFGDEDFHFNIDSLRTSFGFGRDGDAFWLNGEEFGDFEELRKSLEEQFKDMDFDFDFGNWGDGDHKFNRWHDEDSEGARIVLRSNVFIRSARESDKEIVGADKMEDLKINDISFYPNPNDGRFTVDISTGNESLLKVRIIDPDGAVVYEKSDQSTTGEYSFKIDLSQKRKGIYLLQVIQNNSSLTKRIIIE